MNPGNRDRDGLESLIEEAYARPDFMLGTWSLGKELGKGGFGVARLAHKEIELYGTQVTMTGVAKLINPSTPNVLRSAESIYSEIRNLALLNSRFIAKLLDVGKVKITPQLEIPFLIMDYIEGASLQKLVAETVIRGGRGISPRLFRVLATNSLRALRHAHELDLLHLDIKPDNILYSSKDDAFVLIDFGLALISGRSLLQTYVGGTNGYMAPETLEEKTSKAADIYSLGMSFYYALTGINPIYESLEKFQDEHGPIQRDDLRPWQIIANQVQPDFNLMSPDQRALIEPMLSLNPSDRPSLAQLIQLADQLLVSNTNRVKVSADNDEKQTWQHIYKSIKAKLISEGPSSFSITIDNQQYKNFWFKFKSERQQVMLICPKIKNPLILSRLGWKNYQVGMMYYSLSNSDDFDEIASVILTTITKGLDLEPPIQIS